MKYSQATQGRIFIIRLEDGDIIHEQIEQFARDHSISAAALIIIGGADQESKLIVGPEKGREKPIVPMQHILDNVHEVSGAGTIFPDQDGNPLLHMHISCGRKSETVTGCVRTGVKTWHIIEIVLIELLDSTGVRVPDSETGFELLQP